MSKYGFVYLWFDKKHKMFYLGSHWGSVDDGYICSSAWMKRALKQRPSDFKRRIITIVRTEKRDLRRAEERWLSLIKASEVGTRYYNIHRSGATTRKFLANYYYRVDVGNISAQKANVSPSRSEAQLLVGMKVSAALSGKKRGPYSAETKRAISEGKKVAYNRRRAAGLPLMSEKTKKALDRTGTTQTAATKKLHSITIRAARAANPDWDKTHDLTCETCGEPFKGRESQLHCSARCRANHWYRTKKSPRRAPP